MTLKAIRGVPRPHWWQSHPTLAFCAAWTLVVAGVATVATVLFF